MKKSSYLLISTLALGALIGLTGCKKSTGGGSFIGAVSGEKITLGFQMRCEDVAGSGYLTGQFQYKDHGNKVAFHGVVDKSVLALIGESATCEQIDLALAGTGLSGIFGWTNLLVPGLGSIGTYTPQPKNLGLGGDLNIIVHDAQVSDPIIGYCPDGTDGIIVELTGGIYDGYLEGGCLDNGNFTVFGE